MKFPKFIKSQQSKKFCGGDQLLLTESTYSAMSNNNKFFTPQKRVAYIINDYKYINDKTYNIQTPRPESQQQAQSTPFASKADTSIADLFQFKTPMTANTKHVNFIDSVGSPRYVKTSAKRLQRNRLQHVKSKPSNYALRSSVLHQRVNKADCLDSFVTPIRAINEESTTESMLMNTSSNSSKSTGKKTTVTNNQQKTEQQQVEQKENQPTETTSKRFSLSRLTKLVSQSALKALTPSSTNKKDRRSYGSNCSSLSSISFQTDDANDTVDDDLDVQPPKVLNVNLVKLIDKAASPVKPRRVPCMGVSSVMIKSVKAKNQSITNYQPYMQLISKPAVFSSAEPVKQAPKYSSANVYDKLDRAALVNSSKSATPKKATPTYLRHQTTCRITIFNGNHNKVIHNTRKHYSSSQLNESAQYDQIIF